MKLGNTRWKIGSSSVCKLATFSYVGLTATVSLMSMTFEDLEGWQKARQLVRAVYALTRTSGRKLRPTTSRAVLRRKWRSLLYVIEDNFPASAREAIALRRDVVIVGKLLSGLIRSTGDRR